MSTLGERVREARDYAKLTQAQLAEKIGCTQSSISEIESGDIKETGLIVKIALECGVSPYWLDHGKGKMVKMTQAEKTFHKLPPEEQERVIDLNEYLRARGP